MKGLDRGGTRFKLDVQVFYKSFKKQLTTRIVYNKGLNLSKVLL